LEIRPPSPASAGLRDARKLAGERRWAELTTLLDRWTAPEILESAELAYLLADALRRVGRGAEAVELNRHAVDGAMRMGDCRLHLRALNLAGMLAFDAGNLDEAQTLFLDLLALATGAEDDEFAARASNNLGVIANVRGERELALTSYERALASYQRLGHARGLAQTHYNLGISYRDIGFAREADRHYSSAIRFAKESDSLDVVALAETERGYLRARAGDGALAESLGARALLRHQQMEDPAGAANALRLLAEAASVRGDRPLALQRLEDGRALLDRAPDPLLRAEIERDMGALLLASGDQAAARALLLQALHSFADLGARAEEDLTRELLTHAGDDLPHRPVTEQPAGPAPTS
jgi:tetratricopeptide (TPR) repeat protein